MESQSSMAEAVLQTTTSCDGVPPQNASGMVQENAPCAVLRRSAVPGPSETTSRMSFKGKPGQDGFKRRVALVEAMSLYPPERLFGQKDKLQLYQQVTAALNKDELFSGQLKQNTTRDKWYEAMNVVEGIVSGGQEQYIRLAQNGGNALSELDEAYLRIAEQYGKWLKAVERDRADASAEAEAKKMRSETVMNTFKRRITGQPVTENEDQDISDGDGDKDSSIHPSELTSTGKSPSDNSFGRGSNKGSVKRAKNNPALTPDRRGGTDMGEILDFFRDMHRQTGEESEIAKLRAATDLEREKTASIDKNIQLEREKAAADDKRMQLIKMIMECNEKGISLTDTLPSQQ
eukprot:765869-Hanusia_phi.AAC.2